jgi:lipoate-protein ligase A
MLYNPSPQSNSTKEKIEGQTWGWHSLASWRVSPLVVADQQQHIDESEQLLREPGNTPSLYWSSAEPEGLVLGFSQKHNILNPAVQACDDRTAHIPIYHRRAGGTAVLVGPHMLSLDVMLPTGHPLILPDIVESYRWFGELWVATFAQLGIATRVVSLKEAHAQRALRKHPETAAYESLMYRACYGTLSPYEVVVGQRKLVGLDMIRRKSGTLLQAGVLLHWDTAMLAYLLGHTSEEQHLLRDGLQQRAIGVDALSDRHIPDAEIREVFERLIVLL